MDAFTLLHFEHLLCETNVCYMRILFKLSLTTWLIPSLPLTKEVGLLEVIKWYLPSSELVI